MSIIVDLCETMKPKINLEKGYSNTLGIVVGDDVFKNLLNASWNYS